MPWSKEQTAAYSRKWYLENRERLLELRHARYQKNKEKILAQTGEYHRTHPEIAHKSSRKYQEANRDVCRKRNRDWRARNLDEQRKREREKQKLAFKNNPDKLRAINRKWARANKSKILANSNKRRAIKKGATLGDPKLIEAWMLEMRSRPFVRCHWCGTKVSGSDIHFDHAIALGVHGSHSIGNICCSCPDCNLSKREKLPSEWDKHPQIFLSL